MEKLLQPTYLERYEAVTGAGDDERYVVKLDLTFSGTST